MGRRVTAVSAVQDEGRTALLLHFGDDPSTGRRRRYKSARVYTERAQSFRRRQARRGKPRGKRHPVDARCGDPVGRTDGDGPRGTVRRSTIIREYIGEDSRDGSVRGVGWRGLCVGVYT